MPAFAAGARRLGPAACLAAWAGAASPSAAQPTPAPLSGPGGLAPPPPVATQGEARTRATLEQAEREDSGRGLEFLWARAGGGARFVHLHALRGSSLVDTERGDASGSGWGLNAAVGARLIFLSLGVGFQTANAGVGDLWTLGGNLGLHLPYGALEPSVSLTAGYASLGLGRPDERVESDLSADGFFVGAAAAVDYYVDPLISLGLQTDLSVLGLSRGASEDPRLGVYGERHSATGLGVGLNVHVGLHL